MLIRSFNVHFLQDDSVYAGDDKQLVDSDRYLKSLVHFLQSKSIEPRLRMLLEDVAIHDRDIRYSHGMLEEMELVVAVICQIFLCADKLNSFDPGCLQAMKDCLLFGTSQMINLMTAHNFGSTIFGSNSSRLEKMLKRETAAKLVEDQYEQNNYRERLGVRSGDPALDPEPFSLLEVKAQIGTIKIFISYTAALYNLLSLDKEQFPKHPPRQEYDYSYTASPANLKRLVPRSFEYLQEIGRNNILASDFDRGYFCDELGKVLAEQLY